VVWGTSVPYATSGFYTM